MVFLKNKGFHNGEEIDIHVRTKIDTYYSYVESAAARIGKRTLEKWKRTLLLSSRAVTKPTHAPCWNRLETTLSSTSSWDLLSFRFRFYKHCLTVDIYGGAANLRDSQDLVWSRAGEPFKGNYI